MMRLSFGHYLLLNLLFIVPFFISHANGVAGFASAHGVVVRIWLTMFVLYIFTVGISTYSFTYFL